ncbi:hypothetical protein DFH08DRAFT_802200 [Mycena albidolilacea]|uniref:Uncharacterized protein n=1 Tax=Mycena albidolilacea TaxID=1033008 RepID=A0AAD7AGW5_9AGAR|nr:hypothetical protein DFH08DRAFT_802200 [Mycena albidolilacea]
MTRDPLYTPTNLGFRNTHKNKTGIYVEDPKDWLRPHYNNLRMRTVRFGPVVPFEVVGVYAVRQYTSLFIPFGEGCAIRSGLRACYTVPFEVVGELCSAVFINRFINTHLNGPQNWVLRGFSQVSAVLGAPAVETESNTLGKSHPFASSNQNNVAEVNRHRDSAIWGHISKQFQSSWCPALSQNLALEALQGTATALKTEPYLIGSLRIKRGALCLCDGGEPVGLQVEFVVRLYNKNLLRPAAFELHGPIPSQMGISA